MNALMPKINCYSNPSNLEFKEITIKVREERSFFYINIELDNNLHADAQVELENGYIRILTDDRQHYLIPEQRCKTIFDRLIKLPENVERGFFKKTIYKNQISLIFPIKTVDNLCQMYY